MPTLLEAYISKKYPDRNAPVSPIIAIIGTDKENHSLLLPLYEALEVNPEIQANCLSAYLWNNDLSYTPPRNTKWQQLAIATPTLNTFIIAHIEVNKALNKAAVDGKVSVADFMKHYTGNEGPTYREIIRLLKNDYNTYSNVNHGGKPYGQLVR